MQSNLKKKKKKKEIRELGTSGVTFTTTEWQYARVTKYYTYAVKKKYIDFICVTAWGYDYRA